MSDTSDSTPVEQQDSPPRNIEGVIYPSRLFKYDREKRQFTSTISQTPAILRQLWDDSFELGFGIRSAKTGRVACFVLKVADTDEDGRYVRWFFESADIESVTAVVLNE